VTGAVFRDTVRFTGELEPGTLTVKNFFNGNKYITTKYKYKYLGSKYKYKYFTCMYKYKYIKNVLKYKYKYQVPHLCSLQYCKTEILFRYNSSKPTLLKEIVFLYNGV